MPAGRRRRLKGARQFSVNLDLRAIDAIAAYARAHGLARSQAVRDLVMGGAKDPLLDELNELRGVNLDLAQSIAAISMVRLDLERELGLLRERQQRMDAKLNPMKRVNAKEIPWNERTKVPTCPRCAKKTSVAPGPHQLDDGTWCRPPDR